jgi:hypothetical protein
MFNASNWLPAVLIGPDADTQAAILAVGVLVSLTSVAFLAGALFGMFSGCGEVLGACLCGWRGACSCVDCCDCSEWCCCLTIRWACLRCCPCCTRDYAKKLKKRLERERVRMDEEEAQREREEDQKEEEERAKKSGAGTTQKKAK